MGRNPGGLEQLVPAAELDPGAAERLAGGALALVDRRPAGVDDGACAMLDEERVDVRRGAAVARRVAQVVQEQLDRLRRVLLVRADHAARAALDPPGRVDA